MCGIVGIWDQSNSYDQEELSRDLKTSVGTLKHRGPDDNGTWSNERGLGLGHTRLSILDLSSRGHIGITDCRPGLASFLTARKSKALLLIEHRDHWPVGRLTGSVVTPTNEKTIFSGA